MKKLSITLLGLILAAYALADSSGKCGYNLIWSYNEATKTLTILGSGEMDGYSNPSDQPWANFRSQIEKVEIGNDVTSIGVRAFNSCKSLKQIVFSKKITVIGDYAFSSCESLTDISIPVSVNRIGINAFAGTGWFNSITDYGPVYLDNWLIGYNGIKPYGKFIIEPGTKGIADRACYNCTTLESVQISDDVLYIGNEAFSGCSKLTSVFMGNSIKNESRNAFSQCQKLSTIFYTGDVAPTGWIATTNTYVPNKSTYINPNYINGAGASSIKEMMSFENEFTYTGQAPTPTRTNNVEGYEADLTIPTLKSNAGNYTEYIPVKFTKDDTSFSTNIRYDYSIRPILLNVSVANFTREYGEDNPTFIFSYSGFVNGESENVLTTLPIASTTATKASDVGTYPISINGGAATNYSFKYEPGTLTITKALLTAKVNDATKQYGTDNPTFSITYAGLKNDETSPKWSEELKYETAATKTSDAGNYEIRATGTPRNYELSKIDPGKLTVTQAPLIIKANNATRKYFEANPVMGYSCSGLVNNDGIEALTKEPTITTAAMQTSNAGDYEITASDAEAKNYSITYEKGKLTVAKRQLTVTANSVSRDYGDENPMLTMTYNGFVNDENESILLERPSISTTATEQSNAGTYPISLLGGHSTNYELTLKDGTLTINKAPLYIIVEDATREYGDDNPNFQLRFEGLKLNETAPQMEKQITLTSEAGKTSSVGEYEIVASGGIATNYLLTYTPGTLKVTPAPLTVTVLSNTRNYGDANPTFDYSVSTTKLLTDIFTTLPTIECAATNTSPVGKYIIKASGAVMPNYTITYENSVLLVEKRPLDISANDSERKYGEQNPEFKITYKGFANGEDESFLLTKPSAECSATVTSDAGVYSITVDGASNDNYFFKYYNGTLTIHKAEQTINWEQDLSGLKVGDQVELKAEVSSGLPVTYTLDDTNAAEIYSAGGKTYLDCKAGGQFLIRAMQNGSENYHSSPKVSNIATIAEHDLSDDPLLTIKLADIGIVSVPVTKGRVYTFTIEPNVGWKIHSVSFNNEDVTNLLSSDGKFTSPAITSNSTLSVFYEQDDNSSVNAVRASQVMIQACSSGIRVTNAKVGDVIQIYTVEGLLQKSMKIESDTIDISLAKDNVYVVKVSGKTIKLCL